MLSKDQGEDIAFFLYLLPIVASIVYGIYEWYSIGRTSAMPYLAYAIVAKSQYLFLTSLIAICAAIIVEVRTTGLPQRDLIVGDNTSRLQILAIVVLVVSLAAAISVGGYNIPNGISVFVNGRYPLIYAFFLVGISLLLSPRQILGNAKASSIPEILGLLLLVAAPVVFYLGTRVHLPFGVSAVSGLVVAIVGIALVGGGSRIFGRKAAKQVAAPQTVS
ncbi:MAG: hypothetical protein JRN20_12565 [Nitrososphaerota archaeon]|nr:hypothetical protein [Nitrososphaerota archaeon]